jgi:hypothetical protein
MTKTRFPVSKRQKLWFGIILLVGAVVVGLSATHLVDVPGPMEPGKPEFTFQFTNPLLVLSVILALGGGVFQAWSCDIAG